MKRLPGHLEPATRKWINKIRREYVLEERHTKLLILAGEALDRGAAARELVAAEGMVIKDRFGQSRPHPAVAIERDCRIGFCRLLKEVGLDDEEAPEPVIPDERFLKKDIGG